MNVSNFFHTKDINSKTYFDYLPEELIEIINSHLDFDLTIINNISDNSSSEEDFINDYDYDYDYYYYKYYKFYEKEKDFCNKFIPSYEERFFINE